LRPIVGAKQRRDNGKQNRDIDESIHNNPSLASLGHLPRKVGGRIFANAIDTFRPRLTAGGSLPRAY
jgi:hypothetical protein